jgi:arylsulfatase A-like enzyme
VDGLDRDFITSDVTPNLYAWKNAGAELPDAINVYPTATTPNMSSLYTGAYPSHTGVGGNLVFRKKEKRYQQGPRPRNVTSLNEAFQSAGHATAGLQIYMMEKADRYARVQHAPPHDVTTMALALLSDQTSIPTLMAVLFETVDKVSHRYGPDSPQARSEARTVDHEIATIVNRYAELGILKDTMVVITADHGMSAADHVIDKAAVSRAVGALGLKTEWLVRPNQKLADDADLYLLEGGNLLGYFNRDFSPAEQQGLFSALQKIEGVGLIHDSTTLRRMNAHPTGGDFVAEPAPNWRFRGNRGTHGTNRESDGYESFFGAGVKPGVKITGAHTVDIMPTILRAFNIQIPKTVDGRPLVEGLQ